MEKTRKQEIRDLQRQRADAINRIARFKKRRAEVLAKRVRDEARRRRFVRRLDQEISRAEGMRAIAEANLTGLGVDI